MTEKFIDLAGNEIKLGDVLTFAYGTRGAVLGFGRVIRFTAQQIVMARATRRFFEDDESWTLRDQHVQYPRNTLIITGSQRSLPIEVFKLFDSLDITGKKPTRPRKKKSEVRPVPDLPVVVLPRL